MTTVQDRLDFCKSGFQHHGRYRDLITLLETSFLEIEGHRVRKLDRSLQVGDIYIAQRNIKPQLGIVAAIDPTGCVISLTRIYSYDISECVPVEFVDE